MSLEGHCLRSLLDFFPENLRQVSDEQGEHFYQDIKVMEYRGPGFEKDSVLADIVPLCCLHSVLQKIK
jgi:predicted HAD superfamily phosphohydrolase